MTNTFKTYTSYMEAEHARKDIAKRDDNIDVYYAISILANYTDDDACYTIGMYSVDTQQAIKYL